MRSYLFTTFLLALALAPATGLRAQGLAGTWKRTSSILINADGSKQDMQAMLLKYQPCQAGVKHVFTATGDYYTVSPKGCGIGDEASRATWKVSGNNLVMVPKRTSGFPSSEVSCPCLQRQYRQHDPCLYGCRRKALHSKTARLLMTYQRL
jgi:hypothetical protein